MSLTQLFNDYTFQIVAMGAGILGLISGLSGTFAVLKKQSLLGDAVSHSALLGIALIFIITGSRQKEVLLLGAVLSGGLAVYLIGRIVKNSKIDYGSALGLVMSVLFGGGLVLLTVIQKQPNANQAGIESFIFGQASALLKQDVINLSIVFAVILAVVVLFWKEFKLTAFDSEFAQSMGFPVKFIGILTTFITVLAIIAGLQTVGVILMSALLIAPAVAARQWTNKLWLMALLSSLIGAVSGVTGAVLSSAVDKMPTGPAIVITVTLITLISVCFAPQRGILWRALNNRKNKKYFQKLMRKEGADNAN